MSAVRGKNNWVPRHIGLFASVAFALLIIFNKSEFKIRFLDWGAGALVLVLVTFFFLTRGRVAKKELLVIAVPLLWMLYASLGTPFAFNAGHHISALAQVFILTLIASFIVISVFTDERLASKTTLATAVIWTAISFGLFIAWYMGYLAYEKKDFSGLFGNRNAFAIQSVIIIAMMSAFVKGKKYIKIGITAVTFIMIVFSLSIKGFFFFFFVLFFPYFLHGSFQKKNAIILLGCFVITSAWAIMPNIQERITRVTMVFTAPDELRQGESAFLRAWLMSEGFKTITEKPVFGTGVDNARYTLIPPLHKARGADEGLYSHNNYIEMGINAGIPGFILFYFPLAYIFFKTKKGHPHWTTLKTFLLLYLLMGMAMVQYNNFISIILYCLIIFLYLYYKGPSRSVKNSLRYQHPQTIRPY